MAPIFVARRYDDTLDALSSWRRRGYRIGIPSNAPWGTPPRAWHEELERHGLAERCDLAFVLRRGGVAQPALPLFRAALNHFACRAEDCLFVGDDPRWEEYGARRAGIAPLLIDRGGAGAHGAQTPPARDAPEPAPAIQNGCGDHGHAVRQACRRRRDAALGLAITADEERGSHHGTRYLVTRGCTATQRSCSA